VSAGTSSKSKSCCKTSPGVVRITLPHMASA
jgi:hypothetical protein